MSNIFSFLLAKWRWILAALAVWLVVWLRAQGVTPEGQMAVRLEKFQAAMDDRDSVALAGFFSDSYEDDWGYRKADIVLAMQDVTAQFLSLKVEWREPRLDPLPDGSFEFVGRPRLSGQTLSPVGHMMISEAARVEKPFRFVWRKEGWFPWSWRLVRVENDSLQIPAGYTPGSLSTGGASLEDLFSR